MRIPYAIANCDGKLAGVLEELLGCLESRATDLAELEGRPRAEDAMGYLAQGARYLSRLLAD